MPLELSARAAPMTSARRDLLTRRIRIFVALTITYNVVEAVVALIAGTRVGSTAR